ncbi:fam-a protein [Plasmodium chabaudi adami]|uniref:Fam-a protein n=1 Tax=Plasmodium chabaudi adami TaxID=5826 RepID=A0A1D3LEN5_PLACE|nr:fam-a protein [Plasmodium chabaudi adami]
MNNGYVKKIFFVLILLIYVNDKVLTTEHEADNAASSKTITPKTTTSKTTTSKTTTPKTTTSKTTTSKTTTPKTTTSKTTTSKTTTPKTTPSKTTISKITPSETASFETVSFESAVPEMTLPRIVLTNTPSPRIASIPVIFKLDTIYKRSKHLLCINPAETNKARENMDEAVTLLQYHATTNDNYKYHSTTPQGIKIYIRKDRDRSPIGRCQFQISNPNKYNDIINILWDPNGPKKFDPGFISGKIVRSYNRNLFMVLKLYKNETLSSERYFYALVKKAQISEDTTIIVMSSGNINDNNPFNTKIFKNTILESMNSFDTDIDLDDAKNIHLKKMFVNLSGYLIKKENDHVDITLVNSMDFNVSRSLKSIGKNPNIEAMQNMLSLQSHFGN